jgi:hypothetical protein
MAAAVMVAVVMAVAAMAAARAVARAAVARVAGETAGEEMAGEETAGEPAALGAVAALQETVGEMGGGARVGGGKVAATVEVKMVALEAMEAAREVVERVEARAGGKVNGSRCR